MQAALTPDMLATDLAEYLVRKQVPFRETHHISGRCVRLAETRGVALSALTVDDLRSVDGRFGEDVVDVWKFEASVERRDVVGGTARKSVLEQVKRIRGRLA